MPGGDPSLRQAHWPTGAESRNSQARSQIRCNWILREYVQVTGLNTIVALTWRMSYPEAACAKVSEVRKREWRYQPPASSSSSA